MGMSSSAAAGMGRDERSKGPSGPGIRIPVDERHALAVRQSLRWAERAAQEGDYERALGWLRMVEQVDGALEDGWRRRREEWRAAWTGQLAQGARPRPRAGSARRLS